MGCVSQPGNPRSGEIELGGLHLVTLVSKEAQQYSQAKQSTQSQAASGNQGLKNHGG